MHLRIGMRTRLAVLAALATVGITAAAFPLLVRFLGGVFRRHSQRIQLSMGEITRIAEEVLQGHKIIKVFGGQKYENDRFEAANEHNRRMEMRMLATRAGGDGVTVMVTAFGVAGVIFLISQIEIEVDEEELANMMKDVLPDVLKDLTAMMKGKVD